MEEIKKLTLEELLHMKELNQKLLDRASKLLEVRNHTNGNKGNYKPTIYSIEQFYEDKVEFEGITEYGDDTSYIFSFEDLLGSDNDYNQKLLEEYRLKKEQEAQQRAERHRVQDEIKEKEDLKKLSELLEKYPNYKSEI